MPSDKQTTHNKSAREITFLVEKALNRADEYCAEQGARLTPVRRKTLEILLRSDCALGAYAILDALRDDGFGSQPPVAYRALDFLTQHGFVHKIERMNAFVACDHPEENHSPAFLICRVCDNVEEAHATSPKAGLGAVAQETGFRIERTVIEAEGVCPKCSESAHA